MFKVHKHEEFERAIMPNYFRRGRYKSFLRQLSMYKFHRILDCEDRGSYRHSNFQRDKVELCRLVTRESNDSLSAKKIKSNRIGKPSRNETRPMKSGQYISSTGKQENYIVPFLLMAGISTDIMDEIISTFGSNTQNRNIKKAKMLASRSAMLNV